MLKDKEIQTLKRQMEIMQHQLQETLVSRSNNEESKRPPANHRYEQNDGSSGGLILVGSSLLNNKLDKAKSKTDLFLDFRGKLHQGETMEDYIMNQATAGPLDLEQAI